MKTNNRLVLPLIVILLVISLPFTAIGLGTKIYQLIKGDNPEHLPKIGNKLYYYIGNKLIGTYKCKNSDCDTAEELVDDPDTFSRPSGNFNLKSFNDGYVFIQDGDEVILYNLPSKKQIGVFKSYKNYGTNISNSYVVIQNTEGKYGLYDIENIMLKIPNNYLYIGVSEIMAEKKVEDLRLLVKDIGSNYYLIDIEGEEKSVIINKDIVNYDDNYIFTLDGDLYQIYNYGGEELLKQVKITKVDIYNDNYIVTNKNGDILIYPYDLSQSALKTFKYDSKNISYSIEKNILSIKDDQGEEIDTYNFNTQQQITEDISEDTQEE